MNQPLYKKIYIDLKNDILDGTFLPGSQLPTEMELAENYQVSRITSKRALTELEQAGFIFRIRGKGSFVKEKDEKTAKKANRILFILPFLNDLSVGNFADGLSPIMQEHHIDIMMSNIEYFSQKKADDLINEFDGLIYYVEHPEKYLDLLTELALKKFPVILLDKKIYDLPFPAVISDNVEGGRIATTYLIEQGHQRIGYLFGQEIHAQSVRQRYLGYLHAIKEANLSFLTAIDDEQATTFDLLNYVQQNSITALICENDLTAITAMNLFNQEELSVPDHLSIIGFDDIQAARLVNPPLTTVAQNFKTIGETAGNYLIQWIEQDKIPDDIKIPVSLIKRESTKELFT